jgi:pimeloyl-ACP methyl ester carboxylesterase/DNA-directed RNA polymerase subunit F
MKNPGDELQHQVEKVLNTPFVRGAQDWVEYSVDAMQRYFLFWDTMRQRGNNWLEHRMQGRPPVLMFDYEVIIDGKTLERPVNYSLLSIIPTADIKIDHRKRPFVIIDPRAGHGPGIGGMKQDSEVGVALKAGHPVYFVSFTPFPVDGQTLQDIWDAEALFLKEVIKRHPGAEKPSVVGNCQAGWAIAMLAALEPELMGMLILNGSPMSYWAGNANKNPMRYSGGLLGGKWLSTMISDMGNGKFDGAHLVQNFENLNPANTLWEKEYNLYSRIDTEADRYLEFEKWWSGYFLMNTEEIDSIVGNLFIGNRLERGTMKLPDGRKVDLRNIKSPIVIFSSFGDNITPPQQALDWIIDVYGRDEAILQEGQVIVYTLHENIGHLGIFVGGAVAKKQHAEFVNNVDMINTLPPGLYEMIIDKKNPFMEHAEFVSGEFTARFERRKIADIKRLGDPGRLRDESYFRAVAEVSNMNDRLYKQFVQPWVKFVSNDITADMIRWLHPLRMKYHLLSDLNPVMPLFKAPADWVRQNRRPARTGNYFTQMERNFSSTFADALNAYRDLRDDGVRNFFKTAYGPMALGGVFQPACDDSNLQVCREKDQALKAERDRLRGKMEKGGDITAVVRLILLWMIQYGMIDYRSRLVADQLVKRYHGSKMPPEKLRRLVREQYYMIMIDEEEAIASLAKILPTRQKRLEAVASAAKVMMISDAEIEAKSPLAKRIAKALDIDFKDALKMKI